MIKLRYGNTNTFLLQGTSQTILIDTGYAGTLPSFYKCIKEHGVKVSDITYILATHYHPDHIGLISELMEQGTELLLMESQVGSTGFSDRIFAREQRLCYKPIDASKARVLKFSGSRQFLDSIGIAGEIISTPSHSSDSISVILDDGTAIVGDLEPLEYLAGYEDNKALKADWDKVLGYRPKVICYAHANEQTYQRDGSG